MHRMLLLLPFYFWLTVQAFFMPLIGFSDEPEKRRDARMPFKAAGLVPAGSPNLENSGRYQCLDHGNFFLR